MARHRIGTVLGADNGYLSSIDAPAGILNVVDDQPLTKRDYVSAVATAAGTSLWLRAPGRSALLLGDRLTGLDSHCRNAGPPRRSLKLSSGARGVTSRARDPDRRAVPWTVRVTSPVSQEPTGGPLTRGGSRRAGRCRAWATSRARAGG